jgi:hypothetical protein
MPLSKRFLKIISDHFVATPTRLKAFAALNPQRFYVENVRAILGTNTWIAKKICETAVRQGLFIKQIQVLCPDGGVAITVESEDAIPARVRCYREQDGELEEVMESTDHLKKMECYTLVRASV